MTDWVVWHDAYDDPASSLSRRLAVVQRRLEELLVGTPNASETMLLSLCSGDGRDVIEVLRRGRAGRVVRAVLVELDPVLAERARIAAQDLDQVEVRCADAADPASWFDVAPADVLLMCDVFGNVDPEAVDGIVRRASSLVVDRGHVVWTRGGGSPDRRPAVRRSFIVNGFDEVSFDGAPESFGVGVNRLTSRPAAVESSGPLFRFVHEERSDLSVES